MDRSVSVIGANLSQEEISFEKEQLKTSSPITSSSTQTDITTDEMDSEKHDPTYGRPRPAKISMRPRWAPSASCIAAQQKIKSIKGPIPLIPKAATSTNSTAQKPASHKQVSKTASSSPSGTLLSKAATSANSNHGDVATADNSSPLIKVKAKSVKVTHHGLWKYKNVPKGRHCTCPMCGQKFTDSTT